MADLLVAMSLSVAASGGTGLGLMMPGGLSDTRSFGS
jgi:hypothetical protein